MSKTQDIVWPSGSAFLPRLSATGSRGFRLNRELFGPLTTDPVGRHWSLLGAPDSSLVCFSWKRKSEKKKKKKKIQKNRSSSNNQANSQATRKFQKSSKRRNQHCCWHHTDTPSAPGPCRTVLMGLCVCVWAKARAPERPGERRQEGGVSFGSHKSTFKWSLIPEHYRKWDKGKGWGRMAWIPESTRQCFSLLLRFGLLGFVFFFFPLSKL